MNTPITKKRVYIGNITNVKWHYILYKQGVMDCIHKRETYAAVDANTCDVANESMRPDKWYAYIQKIDNELHVRNIFDSSHEKGFEQKNTMWPDTLFYDLYLHDPMHIMDEYLKQGGNSTSNSHPMYFCVEYEPFDNHDFYLLMHCSVVEREKANIEDKWRFIETCIEYISESDMEDLKSYVRNNAYNQYQK